MLLKRMKVNELVGLQETIFITISYLFLISLFVLGTRCQYEYNNASYIRVFALCTNTLLWGLLHSGSLWRTAAGFTGRVPPMVDASVFLCPLWHCHCKCAADTSIHNTEVFFPPTLVCWIVHTMLSSQFLDIHHGCLPLMWQGFHPKVLICYLDLDNNLSDVCTQKSDVLKCIFATYGTEQILWVGYLRESESKHFVLWNFQRSTVCMVKHTVRHQDSKTVV